MEAITSIPPSPMMSGAGGTDAKQIKSGQGQPHPVVPGIEKSARPESGEKRGSVQEQQISGEQLSKALKQANQHFVNEGVSFTYEKSINQMFVQITDKATGAVIKEIPPRSFIEHAIAMKEMVGMLLDQQA